MNQKLLSLFGLKFYPFRPDVPIEALYPAPDLDAFFRRIEFTLTDGGFAMVTKDPGTGKSVALRQLSHRLKQRRDVMVGTVDHPQSRVSDFYRELGDLFGVPLKNNNRWEGFKGLRAKWSEHIVASLQRPVLIIDEAQEVLSAVLNELRILSSKEFDSRSLLCVVFPGDSRFPERLRHPDLRPLESRIRRRLCLEYAPRKELSACLDHLVDVAGNPALMSSELKTTLAEHAAGNYRIMMNLADELLAVGADRELTQLDEKLFFEIFQPPQAKKAAKQRR